MAKSKHKNQLNRGTKEQVPQRPLPATPPQEDNPVWGKIPHWLLTVFSIMGIASGFGVLYPWLSISEDHSYTQTNPFNTQFSITNEGFLPATHITAVCDSDFAWQNLLDPSKSLPLHTTAAYKDFAPALHYKGKYSLPCNHNVATNGHPLTADSFMTIKIEYKLLGIIGRSQTFHFRTVLW